MFFKLPAEQGVEGIYQVCLRVMPNFGYGAYQEGEPLSSCALQRSSQGQIMAAWPSSVLGSDQP